MTGLKESERRPARREGLRGALNPMRAAGYALYDTWLLASFYNTFLYATTPDFRQALFSTTLVSLVALAVTIVAYPRLVRHADKLVLSLRNCVGSGAVLTAGTLLSALADGSTAPGGAMLFVSAVLTGVSSGLLFLGWGRLYAEAGTRAALA